MLDCSGAAIHCQSDGVGPYMSGTFWVCASAERLTLVVDEPVLVLVCGRRATIGKV